MELLKTLVKEVNEREHLLPLLEGVSMTVQLEDELETVCLIIEQSKLRIETNRDHAEAIISGDKKTLEALFTGKMKLREAADQHRINLQSTFRAALFLESVFFLAMPYDRNTKTESEKLKSF